MVAVWRWVPVVGLRNPRVCLLMVMSLAALGYVGAAPQLPQQQRQRQATWWRSEIDYLRPPPKPWTKHMYPDAFIGSPSLLQLPATAAGSSSNGSNGGGGRWLASHDRFASEKVGTAYILGSAGSHPTGWAPLAKISPMYWAQLFLHRGDVYIIGTSGDLSSSGDIVISRCHAPCNGTAWSKSAVLFKGSLGVRFHGAPTPVVPSPDGRSLYRAFDVHASAAQDLLITMLTATTSCADLTLASCWRRSPGLDSNSTGLVTTPGRQWEEPGVAIDSRTGDVSVLVRLDTLGSAHCSLSSPVATLECANRAALLSFNSRANVLQFKKMISFPSGCNKFAVRQDPSDQFFYTLSNPVSAIHSAGDKGYAGDCGQRNNLVLARASASLDDWRTCAVVAWDDLPNMTVSESIAHTGLQYVDFRFDEDDIVGAVRAGYNGSVSFHNANRLLAIRVQKHRALCAGVRVSGSGFQLGVLHNGQAAFNNREYRWKSITPEVGGLMFTQKAGSVDATIQVHIPHHARGGVGGGGRITSATIYAGVCPQQSGHNRTLLSAPGDGWKWEPTNLTFEYNADDRIVQLFKWVRTKVDKQGASRQEELSFNVPADPTFCGTIVVFSPLLI
jgi:hypothetical protein